NERAGPRERAMRALAERLDADIRASVDELIRLHGLSGHAGGVVMQRLAEHYAVTRPLSEGKAAVWGGLVTGALAGLKADVASGGLTLGGGLIAGGVLGALGAAGLARGYNMVRGGDRTIVTWADAILDDLVVSALLSYLAVAHYGRGRGPPPGAAGGSGRGRGPRGTAGSPPAMPRRHAARGSRRCSPAGASASRSRPWRRTSRPSSPNSASRCCAGSIPTPCPTRSA